MSGYILVALVCCIIGALVYSVSTNPKAQELGRGAYWVGLFWAVGTQLAGAPLLGVALEPPFPSR